MIQDINSIAIPGLTPVASFSAVGASAIDVQSDGATRYLVTEVATFGGIVSGSKTVTIFSTPTTSICESLGAILPVKFSLNSQEYSHTGRRCIGVQRKRCADVYFCWPDGLGAGKYQMHRNW